MNRTSLLSLLVAAAFLPAASSAPRFTAVSLKGRVFTAELAATPEQHARGLMFRRAIRDDYAMLFVFAEEEYRSFWMKNTLIPLDIIYIDSARRVVSIAVAVPCRNDPCPTYESEGPARYVLEIRGGLASELNLAPGDAVDFVLPGRSASAAAGGPNAAGTRIGSGPPGVPAIGRGTPAVPVRSQERVSNRCLPAAVEE